MGKLTRAVLITALAVAVWFMLAFAGADCRKPRPTTLERPAATQPTLP